MSAVLGIDPGTVKVGFALAGDAGTPALVLGIEPVDNLFERLVGLLATYPIRAIALGRGTNAEGVRAIVGRLGPPVYLVDEAETTLRARRLYFADHPPRGWRRLIPLGMQLPPGPIDDYAALLIARRFIQREGSDPSGS